MKVTPHAVRALLAAATVLPLPAQVGVTPSVDSTARRQIVVQAKPSKQDVANALAQVKESILPRCWDEKCNKSDSRRTKYLKKWQAVVSKHYIVFTNGPTSSSKKYGVTLEKLYSFIKKELPFEDPKHLLVAYIFKDNEDYYRFSTAITGMSNPRATAGHALPSYYATYYESPRAPTVYHEAAHEIVGACLQINGVGSWWQEGMAVYFEKKMTNQRLGSSRSDFKRGD